MVNLLTKKFYLKILFTIAEQDFFYGLNAILSILTS